ncbi:MAG: acylglycerol kinase family protein [Chloroflexi bacterium]|nr:acylglycerol kinase family protein [Chloroflexota bacterium]
MVETHPVDRRKLTEKSPVERALFIVNRSSATGHNKAVVEHLYSTLNDLLGQGAETQMQVVDEHVQARAQAEAFLAASDAPALVISGGGGGTLRAVIEGLCKGSRPDNLPPPERVRIATLRMGSGNIVAKQFGVPRDPETALRGIIANLQQDRTAPCCIMRCEVGRKDSPAAICFATAMAGFGQFGRSPGDLVRWHHRLPALRQVMARILGIEKLNTLEYSLSFAIRLFRSALLPDTCEVVEVRFGQRIESIRLLSGIVMNFPVKQLPFEPAVWIEDAALSFHAVPYPGRWQTLLAPFFMKNLSKGAVQVRIEGPDELEIRLKSQDAAEFFLDEDPAVFYQTVKVKVAGTLAFVPGPDYEWLPERRDYP